MKTHPSVLLVGDSRRMRGGVSAVIQLIESTSLWEKYHCRWLECQVNDRLMHKVAFLIHALIRGVHLIPRATIIHFHTAPGRSLLVQLPFFLYSLILNKRTVVQFHVGDQLSDADKSRLFRFYCKKANTVITLGDKLRSFIPTRNGHPHVEYLYNPAPPVSIKNQPQNYFLFAAFIDSQMNKGYDILLEGFKRTIDLYPDWKLVICGDGDLEKLKALIHQKNLEGKVVLPGWVTGKTKTDYFNNAFAYCLTSRKEGLPVSILESLSIGLPIISTPVGCLTEFLQDNQNVLFFEPGNAAQLSAQMCRLINDASLYYKISKNEKLLADNLFSLSAYTEKLERIYRNCVE